MKGVQRDLAGRCGIVDEIVHNFKPTFQLLLRPVARFVASRGGTANQVTLAATLGSVVLGGLLGVVGPWLSLVWLLLPVWMFCRMALNAVDGMLAREYGQKTRLGAYLNELADVVSDAALILPLATLPELRPTLVVAIALFASWTELAGVLGTAVGASRRFEGPMGKADRAVVLGVIGAWVGFFGAPPAFALLWQLAILVLLAVTIVRRVSYGLSEAGGSV